MNKRITKLIVGIIIIFGLILCIYSYKNNNKTVIMNYKKGFNNKSISIMLETEYSTGIYEVSDNDEWPENGYVYNEVRSGCENGSTISFDNATGEVVIRGNISDKCYVYFDLEPPSINLAIPSCPNAVTSWDRGLQQLTVTSFTTSSLNCTMEEETINNVMKLNNYIIGLNGTIQGDGRVVRENGRVADYTNVSTVTSYGTTPAYFYNTGHTSNTQTRVDSYWTFDSTTGLFTSVPSKMTTSGTGAYYHVYAQVPEAGFYRICYTINQSPHTSNIIFIAKNDFAVTNASSSTSSQVGETCFDMGYFTASDYINVVEQAYSGTLSPVMTFKMEKTNDSTSFDVGYRFEGWNPNNYVMFNNELWRIIGVFETEYDSNNDGVVDDTDNLVKIIRNDSIGGIAWNKEIKNDWENGNLNHLLNYQYYDWEINKSQVNIYCYGSANNEGKCDYSLDGIHDEYRGMINKVKWYLGGISSNTPESVYSTERDANFVYPGRSASVIAHIGLMYASDYLYAVLASDCPRTTSVNQYNTANCSGKNWLYGIGYEYTLTPDVKFDFTVWCINENASVATSQTSFGYNVRPTLYLSSSVYKVSGTGTMIDPYIIKNEGVL